MKTHKYLLRTYMNIEYVCIYLVFIETSASAGVKAYIFESVACVTSTFRLNRKQTAKQPKAFFIYADRIYANATLAKSIKINKCDKLYIHQCVDKEKTIRHCQTRYLCRVSVRACVLWRPETEIRNE